LVDKKVLSAHLKKGRNKTIEKKKDTAVLKKKTKKGDLGGGRRKKHTSGSPNDGECTV